VSGQNEIRPHIRRNFDQMFQCAEWSLSMKMTVSALVLLYSAIDIAAGLASENTDISGKKRFVKWVNRYMAPHISLACSAHDLYGARCGMVHSFAAESSLSRKGEAKQILYAYGESDAAKLREMITLAQIDYCLVVHSDDLFKAVRGGIQAFLDDAAKNSALLERVNRKGFIAFQNMSEASVDELLRWGKERLGERS
jgi:hypothetical protein